jgi:diaminopimelate epimerase
MMPRVPLRFVKYQGLGNDFVLTEDPLVTPERARRICDRRRGIGADGILTLGPPRTKGAVASMHVYNADGSVPEMCGNGIRCAARHLAERRGLQPDVPFVIDTDAGERTCTAHRDASGAVIAVSVDMGTARLEGEQAFDVAGESLRAMRVSMGNPHAVLLGEEPSRERAGRLGPLIEAAVPGGVNVGFARVARGGVDLAVWERGSGLTDACGTGACAAAVAAVRAGALAGGAPVEVRLPGGALAITVGADLRVTMRGPAERAFSGETDL